MDYQQFLFTITAGLQSACQAEEKITVQTIEQKHTAKIKTVSLYHRGKRTTPWIYMAPFYRLYQHGYSMESIHGTSSDCHYALHPSGASDTWRI